MVSYHRITNGVPEVLKIFQNRAFTCEYKSVLEILTIKHLDSLILVVFMAFKYEYRNPVGFVI